MPCIVAAYYLTCMATAWKIRKEVTKNHPLTTALMSHKLFCLPLVPTRECRWLQDPSRIWQKMKNYRKTWRWRNGKLFTDDLSFVCSKLLFIMPKCQPVKYPQVVYNGRVIPSVTRLTCFAAQVTCTLFITCALTVLVQILTSLVICIPDSEFVISMYAGICMKWNHEIFNNVNDFLVL